MKKVHNTHQAPAPVGPYNQAISHNGVLYISGQIAIEPSTGDLVVDDIETETTQVMKNLGAILEHAGIGYNQLLKCSIFVTDIRDYDRINAVYAQYFDEDNAPARELVEVVHLPKSVRVEISAIAALPTT